MPDADQYASRVPPGELLRLDADAGERKGGVLILYPFIGFAWIEARFGCQFFQEGSLVFSRGRWR